MKKTFIILPVVALGVALAAIIHAAVVSSPQIPREFKSREFMRRKLNHTQTALEGIVLEDFVLVERNARTLSLLSQAAEWQTLPTADYRKHSEEFRRTADALAKSAADRNLDGATLKYVELTINCVNCHKHVRSYWDEMGKRPAEVPSKKLQLDPVPH